MRGVGALLGLMAVALLLRSTALTALAARGVVIDVLAFATVVWALRNGERRGATFGFLLGLAGDLDAAHWLGRHALALALLGYAVGRLSHTLVRDRASTQFVLLLIATSIHQAWSVAFELSGLAGWPYLVQRLLLAAAATAPLGTILLALLRRANGRPLFGHATIPADSTG
jgi:rod shape-determining protein MreD